MDHRKPVPYDYQHNDDFYTVPVAVIDAPMPDHDAWQRRKETLHAPPSVLPELADAYRWPLLSGPQERHLFRQLNYHKFRYNQLITQPRRSRTRRPARLEAEAAQVRAAESVLFSCNTRLVISLARKRARLGGEHFLEAISDGNMALLHCIGKYNYATLTTNKATGQLGPVKFATYATFGIRRALCRAASIEIAATSRFVTGLDDDCLRHVIDRPQLRNDFTADDYRYLDEALPTLDQRECRILCLRHGLAELSPRGTDVWTLREVGTLFGITKERVRQIGHKAIRKLREAARLRD